MSDDVIRIQLTQRQDYQFDAHFGAGIPVLLTDEPPPLGQAAGPTPVQMLATAVGTCLSDSLLFALRKFKQSPDPIHTAVEAQMGRNEEGRIRVQSIAVRLTLGVNAAALSHLDRVLDQFEAFCTVTQSVRQGIPVQVAVFDAAGTQLK